MPCCSAIPWLQSTWSDVVQIALFNLLVQNLESEVVERVASACGVSCTRHAPVKPAAWCACCCRAFPYCAQRLFFSRSEICSLVLNNWVDFQSRLEVSEFWMNRVSTALGYGIRDCACSMLNHDRGDPECADVERFWCLLRVWVCVHPPASRHNMFATSTNKKFEKGCWTICEEVTTSCDSRPCPYAVVTAVVVVVVGR